jgi:hypothetical protein
VADVVVVATEIAQVVIVAVATVHLVDVVAVAKTLKTKNLLTGSIFIACFFLYLSYKLSKSDYQVFSKVFRL